MKTTSSILACIFLSALLGYYSYVNNYESFNMFIGNILIPMMGTIFAINIGIIPVLYYELRKFEKILGEDIILKKTKSEIRQNAIIMTIFVIGAVILGIAKGFVENSGWDYSYSSIILSMLLLTIFMVYDMVSGILSLEK